jgi:hypothetical protein
MRKLSRLVIACLCMAFVAGSLLAQDEEYEMLKTNTPPIIDGDLGDWALAWSTAEGIYLDEWEELGGTSKGPNDISLTFYLLWDEDNLYFAAEVTDDEQLHENTGESIWNGDSFQIGIDPTGERAVAAFDNLSYEYNFGLDVNDKVVLSRLYGNPDGWPGNFADPMKNEDELAIVRDDDNEKTYYELRIPAEDLGPAEFVPGTEIGFGIIYNDSDKAHPGQTGWVGWGSQSIVFGKDNTQMNLVIFSGDALAVSPKSKLANTWGNIKVR